MKSADYTLEDSHDLRVVVAVGYTYLQAIGPTRPHIETAEAQVRDRAEPLRSSRVIR